MMRGFRTVLILALLCAAAMPASARASSLRVAPSTIDVPPGARVATLTLRNAGEAPAHYQVRVFRWVQRDGVDRLEPTGDVVVSPPITTIEPGVDYLARIIRLTDRPPEREEAFRVIVDELPTVRQRANKSVSFLVRYSIPLFFPIPDAFNAPLDWRFVQSGGRLIVHARNPGQRRAKITGMRLRTGQGRDIALASGLAGYVLAGAGRHWSLPTDIFAHGGGTSLQFLNGQEAIHVPVVVSGRH